MEEICGGTKPYLNTERMECEHQRVKEKAIHQFQSKKKMGGDEFSKTYKEQLEKVRIERYCNFKCVNFCFFQI